MDKYLAVDCFFYNLLNQSSISIIIITIEVSHRTSTLPLYNCLLFNHLFNITLMYHLSIILLHRYITISAYNCIVVLIGGGYVM